MLLFTFKADLLYTFPILNNFTVTVAKTNSQLVELIMTPVSCKTRYHKLFKKQISKTSFSSKEILIT